MQFKEHVDVHAMFGFHNSMLNGVLRNRLWDINSCILLFCIQKA